MQFSAVLLSLGEVTLGDSERSLLGQRLPPDQLVRVDSVSPFSRAFNLAVGQVEHEFFLQCDADMLLNPDCSQRLFAAMSPETALVVGMLKDPLQGLIRGVKLFRTRCCQLYPLAAIPNCETSQVTTFLQHGWKVEFLPDSLGLHCPDLSAPLLPFERFRREGCKSRVRRNWSGLTYRLWQLGQRSHLAVSQLAGAALFSGLTSSQQWLHTDPAPSEAFRRWQQQGEGPDLRIDFSGAGPAWERGWQEGHQGSLPTRSVVTRGLMQADPQSWLYLAGFVPARLGELREHFELVVPLLQQWQTYLDENFEQHRSGLRFWEEPSMAAARGRM